MLLYGESQMEIQHKTENLDNQVYSIIKEKIIKSEFVQGEVLNISAIAQQLNVSRTPIMYAFKKLEAEDIVKIIPKVGVLVKVMSLIDVKNIYELRTAIETYAGNKAIDLLTNDEIALLKDTLEKQKEHKNDHQKFWEEDKKFHMLIVKTLGNRLLESSLKDIFDKSIGFAAEKTQNKLSDAIVGHEQILKYLCEKNKEGLIRELEQHIMMIRFL